MFEVRSVLSCAIAASQIGTVSNCGRSRKREQLHERDLTETGLLRGSCTHWPTGQFNFDPVLCRTYFYITVHILRPRSLVINHFHFLRHRRLYRVLDRPLSALFETLTVLRADEVVNKKKVETATSGCRLIS